MGPIVSSIQKLLRQKLNIDPVVLTLKTDLKKDLNLVDWEVTYLLNVIEQRWQISIAENDADKIVSMKHLLEAVRKHVPENSRMVSRHN